MSVDSPGSFARFKKMHNHSATDINLPIAAFSRLRSLGFPAQYSSSAEFARRCCNNDTKACRRSVQFIRTQNALSPTPPHLWEKIRGPSAPPPSLPAHGYFRLRQLQYTNTAFEWSTLCPAKPAAPAAAHPGRTERNCRGRQAAIQPGQVARPDPALHPYVAIGSRCPQEDNHSVLRQVCARRYSSRRPTSQSGFPPSPRKFPLARTVVGYSHSSARAPEKNRSRRRRDRASMAAIPHDACRNALVAKSIVAVIVLAFIFEIGLFRSLQWPMWRRETQHAKKRLAR